MYHYVIRSEKKKNISFFPFGNLYRNAFTLIFSLNIYPFFLACSSSVFIGRARAEPVTVAILDKAARRGLDQVKS